LGFARNDDDASSSAGTTSKEVELVLPSTKVGVLLPLVPFKIEDVKDSPSAIPLKDGRAWNDGFIIVGSGDIIFLWGCSIFMSVYYTQNFYECTRQSWQESKLNYYNRQWRSTPEAEIIF
jgi:hypothetical protein